MSSTETKILKSYTDWHSNGVRVWKLIRMYSVSWVAPGILVAYAATLLREKRPMHAGMLWGMLIGMVLRDIGYLRKLKSGWRVLDKIIDWNKVQDMLG
jgi:hypothetical protein